MKFEVDRKRACSLHCQPGRWSPRGRQVFFWLTEVIFFLRDPVSMVVSLYNYIRYDR